MPEMDGLIRHAPIRAASQTGKNVPIIAVTAKAMKGDRDRCLEAGAWDYSVQAGRPRAACWRTLRAWLTR